MMVDPLQALYFIILILFIQQFDGNILGPKILGDSTGLSGFWVKVVKIERQLEDNTLDTADHLRNDQAEKLIENNPDQNNRIYVMGSKERFAGQAKKIVYALFDRKTGNEVISNFRFIHGTLTVRRRW